ncbi:MAG: hypothetical protein KGJ23_01845 [Euryarchaeota archaeon]|nr:hypothetical protein [Euryarchaeota archaeon]MDE1835337.1 hypothetical protein [Euryarchaeota archaeon]MDE1880768.1 hypothetical protein [Euryarchaeota archaeon]MDE2043633.1 hypothetical protein [Thermoplasmata archaeon]
MTPVKIELAPLSHEPTVRRQYRPADRAYAEAGRTLFGLAGLSVVIFPSSEPEE